MAQILDLITAMEDAGCDAATILRAVKAAEEKKASARRVYEREKKRRQRAEKQQPVPRDMGGHAGTTGDQKKKGLPHTPSKEKNTLPSPSRTSSSKEYPLTPVDLGSEAVGIYREVCVPAGLLDCRTLTGSRKTQLHARLKAVGIDVWAEACRKAAASPFLRGENDRGWRAGIDFLVRESSFTKIMEDAYAERTGRTPHTAADRHRAATDIRRAAMLRVAQEASRGHGGGDAGGGNPPGDGGAAGGHLSLAYTRDG